jgi:hypothetical protein
MAQGAKEIFWQLYQQIEQHLEAGHKAEALDTVCRAFRVYVTVVGAEVDVDLHDEVTQLELLLAEYAEVQ